MSALAYRLQRNRVHLRLVAYRPAMEPLPEDQLRVVLQVVDHGRPIAEDPLHIENTTPLLLAHELHMARNEGWDISPWDRSH